MAIHLYAFQDRSIMAGSDQNNQNGAKHDRHDENSESIAERPDTLSDGRFTIKLSEDMTLRNLLRSGLVEAQGKNREQIPLFVSWPNWLEDGIVCLYARDLHRVLQDTVGESARALGRTMDIRQLVGDAPLPFNNEAPAQATGKILPQNFPRESVKEPPAAIPAETDASPTRTPSKPGNGIIMQKKPAKPAASDTDQDIADKLFEVMKKKPGRK